MAVNVYKIHYTNKSSYTQLVKAGDEDSAVEYFRDGDGYDERKVESDQEIDYVECVEDNSEDEDVDVEDEDVDVEDEDSAGTCSPPESEGDALTIRECALDRVNMSQSTEIDESMPDKEEVISDVDPSE